MSGSKRVRQVKQAMSMDELFKHKRALEVSIIESLRAFEQATGGMLPSELRVLATAHRNELGLVDFSLIEVDAVLLLDNQVEVRKEAA